MTIKSKTGSLVSVLMVVVMVLSGIQIYIGNAWGGSTVPNIHNNIPDFWVNGTICDADGNPIHDAIVSVVNMQTGESLTDDAPMGMYSVNLTELHSGWQVGDTIRVIGMAQNYSFAHANFTIQCNTQSKIVNITLEDLTWSSTPYNPDSPDNATIESYDVFLTDLSVCGIAYTNNNYQLNITIHNNGSKPAKNIDVVITDANPDNSEVILGTISIKNIPPNKEKIGSVSWIPSQSGEHEIRVNVSYTFDGKNISYNQNYGYLVHPNTDTINPAGSDIVVGAGQVLEITDYFWLRGNLTIQSGGYVWIHGPTAALSIDSDRPGEFEIRVEAGGKMTVEDRGMVRAEEEINGYKFRVYGELNVLTGATVEWMYGERYIGGIECYPGSIVNIIGATVTAGTTHNIYCYHTSSPIIKGSNITKSGAIVHPLYGYKIGHGLYLAWSYAVLRRNTIKDNTNAGIYCWQSSPLIEDHNDIRNNEWMGIWLSIYSNPTIKFNNISYNKRWGGMYIESSAPTIENNDFYANVFGLVIAGRPSPILRANNIIRSGLYGVWVHHRGEPLIENNNFTDNREAIYSHDAEPLSVSNNYFTKNFIGMSLSYAKKPVSIKNNNFVDNYQGMFVSSVPAGTEVSYNIVVNTTAYPFGTEYASGVKVLNNRIEYHGGYVGMSLHGLKNSVIANNVLSHGPTFGMAMLWWFNNNIIENNTITDHWFCGAVIGGLSTGSIIRDCKISRIYYYGVWVYYQADASVENSTIEYVTLKHYAVSYISTLTSLNTTFDKTKVYIWWSTLWVKWYIWVYVCDYRTDPVAGAEVLVRDVDGVEIYRRLTGTDGYVRWIICIEYKQWDYAKRYYTPHTIKATKNTFTETVTETIDRFKIIEISLPIIVLPSGGVVSVNKTNCTIYEHFYVTFTEASFYRPATAEWVTLFTGTKTVDLIWLFEHDAKEQIGRSITPIDTYTKIRLVIANVTGVEKITKEVIYFAIPQPTWDISYVFTVGPTEVTALTISIDLIRSIQVIAPGVYQFIPICYVYEEHSSFDVYITPPIIKIKPGETATYTVTVHNWCPVEGTYDLVVITDIPTAWITFPVTTVTVSPGSFVNLTIQFTVPANIPLMTTIRYSFKIETTARVGVMSYIGYGSLTVIATKESKIRYMLSEIEDMINELEDMDIHHGVKHSLKVKLEPPSGAGKTLEKSLQFVLALNEPAANDALNATKGKLGAFRNEVNAQKGKKITTVDALILLAKAQTLLAHINDTIKIPIN